MNSMKIKVGDTVKITAGKDRGREGVVQQVLPRQNKVLVEGMAIYKKHVKSQGQKKPGGIIDIQKSIAIANVAIYCSTCKQVSRVGYRQENNGKKIRICRKCQKELKGTRKS